MRLERQGFVESLALMAGTLHVESLGCVLLNLV